MQDGEGDGDRHAVDPPVDPELPDRRVRSTDPTVLLTVAVGGVAGTAARYALGRIFPTGAGTFPWTTFAVNVTGSFLLGAFLAWLYARRPADRLVRPLVAVGFLGGYTTFSTAMVESAVLVKDGHVPVAVCYLVAGLVSGLLAVALGVIATRRVVRC